MTKKRDLKETILRFHSYTPIIIPVLLLSAFLLHSSLTTFSNFNDDHLALGIPNCQKDNSFCERIVANAGPSQIVNEDTPVSLTGSATDPDPNDKLYYYWKQIEGPSVILKDNNTINPSFMTPTVSSDTTLKFSLTVKDQQGASSSPSEVIVIVKPESSYSTVQTPANTTIAPSILEPSRISVSEGKNCATDLSKRPNATEYLTYFNCGHVTKLEDGTTLREFSLVVNESNVIPITNNKTDPVLFYARTFNNTIPGPTMRMTAGDLVKITVYNSNSSKHVHSLHMDSIHSGMMDAVTGMAGAIHPGGHYTYSFTAVPPGVYTYHCRTKPVQSHINHGLYGVMIIDPKVPRAPANEMVMLMNGYNLLEDYKPTDASIIHPPTASELRKSFENATRPDKTGEKATNQIYSINGQAFVYRDHPTQLASGEYYRIYLANMLEFDPLNTFNMNGNMFEYYPAGTGMYPSYITDTVELGQGNRGIKEFVYYKPGMYNFQSGIDRFANLGSMGIFNVVNGFKPLNN